MVDVDPGLGFSFPDFVAVHEKKPGGIPDFVGEIPAKFILLLGIKNILAQRCEVEDGEPDGVGAVLRDEVEGLGRVPKTFGHLSSGIVAHEAGEVHILERDIRLWRC